MSLMTGFPLFFKNMIHISKPSGKLGKKIENILTKSSANYLEFPATPVTFGEIFDEK